VGKVVYGKNVHFIKGLARSLCEKGAAVVELNDTIYFNEDFARLLRAEADLPENNIRRGDFYLFFPFSRVEKISFLARAIEKELSRRGIKAEIAIEVEEDRIVIKKKP